MVAAMRWQPQSSWLIVACDLPDISKEAIDWLLEQRKPGVWGILPTLGGSHRVEPLFAWYDFRMLPVMEKMAAAGGLSPRLTAEHEQVITPIPPSRLYPGWRNVNTVAQREQRDLEAKKYKKWR
jgi:molybdopterin-guanine dinucleotide biosynthesis protein A